MVVSSKKFGIFYSLSTLLLLFVQNSESCTCRNFYHPQTMVAGSQVILLVNITGFNFNGFPDYASFYANIVKNIMDTDNNFVNKSTVEVFFDTNCAYREGMMIISGQYYGYFRHRPCDIRIENPTLQQIENMEKMLISPCKVPEPWFFEDDKTVFCNMDRNPHIHKCQYFHSICESVNNECQWSRSQEFDTCMEESPIENDIPEDVSATDVFYLVKEMCSLNENFPIWACRKAFDKCQKQSGSYNWYGTSQFEECRTDMLNLQEKEAAVTHDPEEDITSDPYYPERNMCATDEDYRIWTCRQRFDTCEEQNGSYSWSNSYEFQDCVNGEAHNGETDVTHVKINTNKITHIQSEIMYT